MRRGQGSSRLARHVIAAGIAVGVFAAAPSAPRAQASRDHDCNPDNPGLVCKEQVDCVYLIFYSKCSTAQWRLPETYRGGPAPLV